MKMKFFFFSLLTHLYLILSSSVMPQYDDDNEQNQYDDFGLVSAFHRYLTIPTQGSYHSLRRYVLGYYDWSPIDCLNLLDRYRSNLVFKVLIWRSLAGCYDFIDPTKITFVYHRKVLKWISWKIRRTFFDCCYSDEEKFTTEMEKISRMIKLAEVTASELKSLGNNDKLINGFDDLVATWKYLMRNISIDFENKSIDYYSLLRTFNEVSILIKTDSSPNGPSLRLFKRYALLWFYLHHIYVTDCNMMIFDIHHHQKIFIFYFVLEFWDRPYCWIGVNELYPNQLILLFEKIYENGQPQIEPILELFREYNLEQSRHLLGVSKKPLNYIDLARSLSENSKKYRWAKIWKFKALAELEVYLLRHGRKVDYSTNL